MNSLERLNSYLKRLERRFRYVALSRGAAAVAGSALAATVLLVLVANSFAFSDPSVLAARILLFLALAFAAGFGLVLPLLRLNRARAARRAERSVPELEQRLVTFAETEPQPFIELLAADTLAVIEQTGADRFSARRWIAGFASAAAAALGVLIWLVAAGPGYLGYGASLLWAGPPKPGELPYYAVLVTPGDATIRRKSDQLISARLVGFEAPRVRLAARYRNAARWEQADMRPQAAGSGYDLLLAGIPDALEYYVEAGGLRSRTYTLNVRDLPGVKRIRVTYHYPKWTGLPVSIEDPGGDIRAVEGTEAEIAVETDRPLSHGVLVLDGNTSAPLQAGARNWSNGQITVRADSRYYVAILANEQLIRVSEDYFINARKDEPPVVRVTRPGRDARVNPIEEVTVAVNADDDFGLRDLKLLYRVNAGPLQTVDLLKQQGAKEAEGSTTLFLEDFKLSPGDMVSLYAVAEDARNTTYSDHYFIQAEPFEREYTQSQQMGGGEGGGEDEGGNRISERQKEIISATWNQIRSRSKDGDTAKFLSGVQSKLRDQARSLAGRIESRELSRANQEFQSFSQEMQKAAEAMTDAAGKLGSVHWQDALQPEQKALQHLLRAEATYRKIQVAFGGRGGRGGGRGGAGRDLESLFDLELDTEKNQYETGQRASARDQRQREMDEAMQKLEQLARRQQELASQPQSRQSFEQRWQQEMLRREAEQLQRRMEQLSRGGQSGNAAASGQSADRDRLRSMAQGQGSVDPRVRQALDRLSEAARDMQRPGSQQRAAEQLRQARDLLSGMRRQEAGNQVEDMARRAGALASQQQDFASRLRRMYGDPTALQPGAAREDAERMANERQQQLSDLQRLERDMQDAARNLASGQRAASSKLRDALGEMQQRELALRMKYNGEMIRYGRGASTVMREAPITEGLEALRDQLRDAQAALDRNPPAGRQQDLDRALAQLDRARERLQRMGGQPVRAPAQGRQQGAGQQGKGEQQGNGQQGDGRAGTGNWGQYPNRQQGGQGSGSWSAMNFGDWQPGEPAGAGQAWQDALRDLSQLRQALRDQPDISRDVEQLMREMQRFDPRRAPGNPALLERMWAQYLPDLDRIELQIRRELGQGDTGQARTGAPERVPPGYADAVAEYFKRLSKQPKSP